LNPSHTEAYGYCLKPLTGVNKDMAMHTKFVEDEQKRQKSHDGKPRSFSKSKIAAGCALLAAGLVWLITPLGFNLPWFSLVPISSVLISGLFIAKALNHTTEATRGPLLHD
jgi:hypothetical protein